MQPLPLRGIFLALLLVSSTLVVGQSAGTSSNAQMKFLTWTNSDPDDWSTGGLFALLGLIGALTTVFGFIGGAIPGTAGKAKIDKDQADLDRCIKRIDELISGDDIDPDVIHSIQQHANNLRDDIRTEQWKQFWIAMILYAFLGAAFATMLADSYLQALIIGAGWTALIGTLGLKKDYQERKDEKHELNQKLINQLERLLATPQVIVREEEEDEDEEEENGTGRVSRSGMKSKRAALAGNNTLATEREKFDQLKSEAQVVNKL